MSSIPIDRFASNGQHIAEANSERHVGGELRWNDLLRQDHGCIDVAQFLRILHRTGDVFEIRALNCPVQFGSSFAPTAAGWFDDASAAAIAIATLDVLQPPGIYVTLNPCSPTLLARATNRIDSRARATTTDADITCRRWILIDIDPPRPSNVSSTDEEMQAALELARTLRGELADSGWPVPLFGMSGNGAYLLFRQDLPNDARSAALHRDVLRAIAQRFDSIDAKIDCSTFNAARIAKVLGTVARKGDYFIGTPDNPSRPHRMSWFEPPTGELLPVPMELLEAMARTAPPSRSASVTAPAHAGTIAETTDTVERCRRYIARMPDAISGQGGHNATFAAACECFRFGLSESDALAIMQSFNANKTGGEPWTERELDHKLADARRRVEATGEVGVRLRRVRSPRIRPASRRQNAGQSPDVVGIGIVGSVVVPSADGEGQKPTIDVGCKDMAALTAQAWSAIQSANAPAQWLLYGGRPSRIERGDDGEPIIRLLNENRMRHLLARVADWIVESDEEVNPVFPVRDIVRDVLATPEMPLPVLTRVVPAPVFANDGQLMTEPGYHFSGQTYYAPARGFTLSPIPERPTVAEIADARTLLLDELLGDFPFVSRAEQAHAITALLLPFARDLVDGPTPLHLLEKPTPGTGATLLVDMLCYPFLGQPVGTMSEGRDDDEWRKRLTAKLMRGASTILIDNLRRKFDSPAVASAITSPMWEDRILGTSEVVRIPVKAAWFATGNNPQISSEIARRVVRIRLDARQDQPWLRSDAQFRHPRLRDWARENRGRLVHAALTLIRAWISAGRPAGQGTLGMFESWAQVMGGILDVAGIPGLLANLQDFYSASDAESGVLRDFMTAWWIQFQSAGVAVAQLWPLIGSHAALPLGDGNERSQRTRLGKLLSECRDRVFRLNIPREPQEMRLTSGGMSHSAQMWQLLPATGEVGRVGEVIPGPRAGEVPVSPMGEGGAHSAPHAPLPPQP
jgi:hypothetical protein